MSSCPPRPSNTRWQAVIMAPRLNSGMREPRFFEYVLINASFMSKPSSASFAAPGLSVVVCRNLTQELCALARDRRVDSWRLCSDATCMIVVAILGVETKWNILSVRRLLEEVTGAMFCVSSKLSLVSYSTICPPGNIANSWINAALNNEQGTAPEPGSRLYDLSPTIAVIPVKHLVAGTSIGSNGYRVSRVASLTRQEYAYIWR